MNSISKYFYVHKYQNNTIDTNIVAISFENLSNYINNLSENEPFRCNNCSSILNHKSEILTKSDFINLYDMLKIPSPTKPRVIMNDAFGVNEKKKLDYKSLQVNEEKNEEEDESPKTPKLLNINYSRKTRKLTDFSNTSVLTKFWICEFCEEINDLKIKENEIPKSDLFYLIDKKKNISQNKDISIVFCLDNSGSMGVSIPTNNPMGQASHLNNEELEMLKGVLDPAEINDILRQDNSRVSYISRKNCIIRAIQKELNKMRIQTPNRIVGMVLFNNEVIIAGDGTAEPKKIMGSNLFNFNKCLEEGRSSAEYLMKNSISETYQSVIESYKKYPEKDQTALGPALVAAVGLASQGKPGSSVIICTDGLANVGLGDLMAANEIEPYKQISNFAKEQGVNINVITIAGEECKTQVLSQIVEITNGNLERINPSNINNEINELINENILARNVTISIRLPLYLRFIEEDINYLSNGGSLFIKNIGNITENTQISFKIKVKDDYYENNIEFIDGKRFSFIQCVLDYISLEGAKIMRVNTIKIKNIKDSFKCENECSINLLANRAAFEIATLNLNNKVNEALEKNENWKKYINHIEKIKKEGKKLNKNEINSMNIIRNDFARIEDNTIKCQNRIKKKLEKNYINTVVEKEEEEIHYTQARKLLKRNYKLKDNDDNEYD